MWDKAEDKADKALASFWMVTIEDAITWTVQKAASFRARCLRYVLVLFWMDKILHQQHALLDGWLTFNQPRCDKVQHQLICTCYSQYEFRMDR